MPDALKPVPASADDDRSLLSTVRPPPKARQIVGDDLQSVKKVVQILDLGNWPQSSNRHADGFSNDGGFANSGIRDALRPIFFLKVRPTLVHTAKQSNVFSHG